MVVYKRKKVTKYRGSITHGGGSRKKRRGAGSIGGRGNAGTGKRAGHKKAGMKDRKLGRRGFNPRRNSVKEEVIVNLNYFTPQKLQSLIQENKVSKEGNFYIIDLELLGIDKVLSLGNLTVKLKVKGTISLNAAEKIKAAGGEVLNSETSAPSAKKAEKE